MADHADMTALHIAAQRKNLSIFLRLLAAGGDLMAPNCYNLSPLQELQHARPRLFHLQSHGHATIGIGMGGLSQQRAKKQGVHRLSTELAMELGIHHRRAEPRVSLLRVRGLILRGAKLDRGSVHMRSLLWHIRYAAWLLHCMSSCMPS